MFCIVLYKLLTLSYHISRSQVQHAHTLLASIGGPGCSPSLHPGARLVQDHLLGTEQKKLCTAVQLYHDPKVV
jgi:hypothetical protein